MNAFQKKPSLMYQLMMNMVNKMKLGKVLMKLIAVVVVTTTKKFY